MIRVSHTHQVRLSVCAQCSEQLRELHKMQSLTHTHTHTSGQTVCLCTVQGAVARASPDAGAWYGGRRQGSAASRPG